MCCLNTKNEKGLNLFFGASGLDNGEHYKKTMGKVNYTPEQIVIRLRTAEVLCAQGNTIGEAAEYSNIG